jgi:predicted GNAT family acetyltransferase
VDADVSAERPAIAVVHNVASSRFEAVVEEGLCRADYRMAGDVMRIVHTEVPRKLEGRGVAGQVVRGALDYARANGLKVAPVCSYVRAYMRRHKETHDLLAEGHIV